MFSPFDYQHMQRALELAKTAEQNNEVPVGAVLVLDNKIIAEGWNQPINTNDPTAHAEIIALRKGAEILKNYRLVNTTLYVTLEPCFMCIGALVHARVSRVLFGAPDPKPATKPFFNHQVEYLGGLMAEESAKLLSDFFQKKR